MNSSVLSSFPGEVLPSNIGEPPVLFEERTITPPYLSPFLGGKKRIRKTKKSKSKKRKNIKKIRSKRTRRRK
jgi:hypothetical protein